MNDAATMTNVVQKLSLTPLFVVLAFVHLEHQYVPGVKEMVY